MLDADALEAAFLVTDTLEALGVPYVVGGSVASIVHGMIRTTLDVDLVADLKASQVSPFVTALGEQFYVDEASIRRAIQRRGSFNLIHLNTMVKIDIFLPKDRPFDRQQLARRVSEPVSAETDRTLWILTAEDIILAKLDWFHMGGEVSERQWRDVLSVVRTQGTMLDQDYLRASARELGIAELLERALEEAASTS